MKTKMTDSPEQPNDDERELVEGLAQFIKEKTVADEFSGAILVAKNGKSIYQTAVGFANQEKQIPNKINTKFNLGSCNKMFTGVAIAQLADKGDLNFTDVVGKFLPDYPNQTVREQITLHQLLTHTSGLGSFIDSKYRDQFLAARENLKTIQQVVDLFKDRPLEYTIGEVNYSSDAYEVLGLIIEAVSGQSYYDFVKQNIFLKANMQKTDNYDVDPDNVPDDLAVGYTRRDPQTNVVAEDGPRHPNFDLNLFKGTAGGSGYSTCPDLVNFGQALLSHQLLSPEMTEIVLTAHVQEGQRDKNGRLKSQGYGFQIWDENGTKRIGHPGRFAGVNARFDVYPDLGLTVVALANYDPPSAFDVAEEAVRIITKL